MGNLRGIDSYGQDMYYETKGGIWMPKLDRQAKSVAKPANKALVPLAKQQPPLPTIQEVINRQYNRPIVDLGFNYTDLSTKPQTVTAKQLPQLSQAPQAPITRADRLLGTGTPARTVNAFKYHNGQYFILENGKTIGLYNDFNGFNKAVGKLRGQGVKISEEMPYAQTVGDTPKAFQIAPKAEAPATKALTVASQAAEAPAANGQKLLGFTPKAEAPATKALAVASQATEAPATKALTIAPKANKAAVFPSADAAEYGRMIQQNPTPKALANLPAVQNGANAAATNGTNGTAANAATNGGQAANQPAGQKPASKAQSKYSNAVINEKVDAYRKAMEKQGLKGQQLEEQVARYKEGLLADRKKHFNKLKGKLKAKNIAKERAQGKLKVKPKETGAFAKLSKFFKGKGGKAAAIAAGIAALGAGLYALLGGKDKKVEETTDIDDINGVIPPVGEDESADEAVEEVPEEVVPAVPEEGEEGQSAEAEYDVFKAIPGSWQWRFAERELLLEHQGEPDYKPTPAEIRKRSDEIVARDGRKMAADDIHTDPLLMQGDDVTIKKPLADLFKEAKQQLIEEHKDQEGYEPTWREMTKIVDQKIKEAKQAKEVEEVEEEKTAA